MRAKGFTLWHSKRPLPFGKVTAKRYIAFGATGLRQFPATVGGDKGVVVIRDGTDVARAIRHVFNNAVLPELAGAAAAVAKDLVADPPAHALGAAEFSDDDDGPDEPSGQSSDCDCL